MLGVVQPNQTKVGDYPSGRWNVYGVVSPDYTVLDVVEIIIENKIRAIPVSEDGELKGLICQLDLLKGLADVQELKSEPAKDFAVLPLITMSPDQSIASARNLMLNRGFSHVPIVEDSKLIGMITAKNIVNRFITPIGATTVGDTIGEKITRFSGTVSDIIDDDPITVGEDASILEVTQKILESEKSAAIQLTGDGFPIAIITPRELLSVVLRFRGRDEMPIYITGLKGIGNFMERAIVEEKIRRVMKRAMKIHPHLEETSIHIQTSRSSGNRSRYEITVNVISKGTNERFSFKREGWDVLNVFDEVGEILDRLLTESKHKPRGISRTNKRIRYSLREKP
jgi:CBS domain-containing protein/ribosome-associated translation inhibitor RaiA